MVLASWSVVLREQSKSRGGWNKHWDAVSKQEPRCAALSRWVVGVKEMAAKKRLRSTSVAGMAVAAAVEVRRTWRGAVAGNAVRCGAGVGSSRRQADGWSRSEEKAEMEPAVKWWWGRSQPNGRHEAWKSPGGTSCQAESAHWAKLQALQASPGVWLLKGQGVCQSFHNQWEVQA